MVINTLYRQMCGIMEENSNSDAPFEANLLIEFVLGKRRIELFAADIAEADAEKLLEYAQKRKEGYPLQYILGMWQFFDSCAKKALAKAFMSKPLLMSGISTLAIL